jgi:hypothetical protein
MPTDVSGTINIIAEVVGNANSPVAGTGSAIPSADEEGRKKNQKNIASIFTSMKGIMAIMGIGGILSHSKVLSSSLSSILRIFGTLVDIFLAPIAPLLVRGMVIFGNIVRWLALFLNSPIEALKSIWTGLLSWFKTTWEEKGGLFGVIKEAALNVTGMALVSALLSSVLFGPVTTGKGLWWLVGKGAWLTKSAITTAIGWIKYSLTHTPFQTVKAVALGLKNVILGAPGLLGKVFGSTAIFLRQSVMKAFGILAATPAGKFTWKALLGTAKVLGVTTVLTWLGSLGIFASMGAAAMAALPYILIGLLIVGVAVSAYFILNYLMMKYFNVNLIDAVSAGAQAHHERFKEDAATLGENSWYGIPTTRAGWKAAFGLVGENEAVGDPVQQVLHHAFGEGKDIAQREQDAILMQADGMHQ